MMTRLVPASESVAHQAIERILETVLSDDGPPPSCVLIEGTGDRWQRHAALLPVEERRRSVIAASSEAGLMDAVRCEIGGATWLPASTLSMETACEAAVTNDRKPCAPIATLGVLENLIEETSEMWVVGWWPQSFWRRQVGPRRLCACLTVIAERLGCVPAILPGPVLVVAGCDHEAIEDVCRDASSIDGREVPLPPGVVCRDVALRSDNAVDRVEDLLAGVYEGVRGDRVSPREVLPVLDLFGGERIGWWCLSHLTVAGRRGWLACPSEVEPGGGCWEVAAEDGTRTRIVEITTGYGRQSEEQPVIRVPGFIGAELRRGSPAGLLVE